MQGSFQFEALAEACLRLSRQQVRDAVRRSHLQHVHQGSLFGRKMLPCNAAVIPWQPPKPLLRQTWQRRHMLQHVRSMDGSQANARNSGEDLSR